MATEWIIVHHPELRAQARIPALSYEADGGPKSKGWRKGKLPRRLQQAVAEDQEEQDG